MYGLIPPSAQLRRSEILEGHISLNYNFSLLPHSYGKNAWVKILIIFYAHAGKGALHQSFCSSKGCAALFSDS
jgi:hypothetical protein